nr:zinc finger, CCHC-type [Tanacetum cinerariifolium]
VAQGGREAEVFQVSNDDTAVAQRRFENKQPEEKTNTDCLVKEQKKEYQTGWKIKTGNVFDFYNQRFLNDKVATGGCRQVKVLEFFDCSGLRQGVEDLKELLHKGAQGGREAEVFQVSNDDTAVAQRRLENKQPEEKTNTDCLRSTQQCTKSGVAKHLGVAVIQQQNGLVKETNVTLFANVRCFVIQSGMSKVFWAEDTTRSTYLVNRSPSSAFEFKKPIDMLEFFCWLASIKQGMLEPVKVKCIFLGYHKSIVGNKLWRFDEITSNVLHRFEFEVKPLGDHTFEVEPWENIDQGAGLQEVQTQDLMNYQLAHDREQHLACELFGYRENSNEAAFVVAALEKIYAHESLTFNNTVSCEVISKWKDGLKDDMDARSDVYALSNGYRKCSNDSDGYYRGINQSRFYNRKLVQTLLEGHSILLLDGSLSGDCDVKKNGNWSCIYAVGSQEYQMVCTILDIASADVGMLDKFNRGLQTDVQVFVDFDYVMGRSITIMESRYELRLVAGIATGALVKGGFRSEVPAQVEVAAYRY